MSTHVPEHPGDWEAQRERLSALLDGQLEASEAAALRAHVRGCAACTAELEALRRVVGALGALPQPVVPRSFALPLSTTLPDVAPAPRSIARAHARPSRWAAVAQWAGAAAACLGFVILAGTFLLGGGYAQSTMATFGTARHNPSSADVTAHPPAATTTPGNMQDMASATPRSPTGGTGVGATPSPTPAAASVHAAPAIEPTAAPDPRATARTTGGALLLGGLAALLVGWGIRRRGAPR